MISTIKLRCFCCQFCYLLFLIPISTPLSAQGTIQWAKYDIAPFFIVKGAHRQQGTGDLIYALLQQNLTEYKHKNQLTNFIRVKRQLTSEKIICTSTFKRKRVLQLFHFSKAAVSLPDHSLHYLENSSAEEHIKRLLNSSESKVSLASLFNQSPSLRVGALKQRQYSDEITYLLKRHNNQIDYWIAGTGSGNINDMLIQNRVDFVLDFPSISFYTSKTSPSLKKIKYVPLEENSLFRNAHIGCTKSAQGLKVINRINAILDDISKTKPYRNAIIKWLPENYRSEISSQ